MPSSLSNEYMEGIDAHAIPDGVLQSDRPLLLKGFVNSWPAVQKAQESDTAIADYIKGFYAGELLTVYEGDSSINGRIF